MANAKPSSPGSRRQNVDAARLEPNYVTEIGKPEKQDDGTEYRTDKLANGDKIKTRVDVDPRARRTARRSA